MKSSSFGVIWFMVLGSIPLIHANDYIIDKETDATLLDCVIAFVVFCVLLLILTIIFAVVVYRRSKGKRPSGYDIEEKEENYQSIYGDKSNGGSMYEPPPAQYETLKTNGSNNGDPKTKQGTPPGTEKGQKDTKESEKQKTLSAFENPAYEVHGVPRGLDKQVEFKPATFGDELHI